MTVQIINSDNLDDIQLWENYNLTIPRVGEGIAVKGSVFDEYYRVVDVVYHQTYVELRVE